MSKDFNVKVRIYRPATDAEIKESLKKQVVPADDISIADDNWTITCPGPGVAVNRAYALSVDELRGRGKSLPKNWSRMFFSVTPAGNTEEES